MCEENKDYSLLRPFDLDAAKRGDEVVDAADMSESKRVAFVGVKGEVVIDWDSVGVCTYTPEKYRQLRMKPLCWLEGKPVYKGDVLYYTGGSVGDTICVHNATDNFVWDASGCVPFSSCSWTKPKTKKEGWINIYPKSVLNGVSKVACASNVFESESSALKESIEDRLDTIHIEWEE